MERPVRLSLLNCSISAIHSSHCFNTSWRFTQKWWWTTWGQKECMNNCAMCFIHAVTRCHSQTWDAHNNDGIPPCFFPALSATTVSKPGQQGEANFTVTWPPVTPLHYRTSCYDLLQLTTLLLCPPLLKTLALACRPVSQTAAELIGNQSMPAWNHHHANTKVHWHFQETQLLPRS